jgi:hypothetical protein
MNECSVKEFTICSLKSIFLDVKKLIDSMIEMLCNNAHFQGLYELTNTIILLLAIALFLSVQTDCLIDLISQARETLFRRRSEL